MVQKITLLPSNLKKVEFFHTFRGRKGNFKIKIIFRMNSAMLV